ncbi:MAG: site-specific integrase [Firmicutes bacterium]|nr:site-specific integrase [Bacillota bacterium]
MGGFIRKRGKDTWQIVYDAPKEFPGQARNRKYLTFHGPEREAKKKLREILRQIDTNTYVDSKKMTLEDYLRRWLRDYCETANLTQTTIDGYTVIIEKHLIPALGDHRLDKLQPLHIQEYYTQKLKSGRADGKGGLSPRTVLHHHRLLHKAFETAIKWQLLHRNICDAVEPPKAEQYEGDIYDEKQIDNILPYFVGTRLYIPILLALATGTRRGEVLAFRWKDLNKKAKTITVNQNLVVTREDGPQFKLPKTKKSRRQITLPDTIFEVLKKHKIKQEEEKLRIGEAYEDNDLICCLEDGSPWHPGTFSNYFHDILEANGLPKIRFHDLRHTHASLLLKQGVHPKIVSERLGHSRIGITLDLYSHVMPGMQEQVANQLDQQIFRKIK